MTATVPAILAWPLLAFMAAVVGLRYVFFNHSQWERYLNHTLAFMLASNLIRVDEHTELRFSSDTVHALLDLLAQTEQVQAAGTRQHGMGICSCEPAV